MVKELINLYQQSIIPEEKEKITILLGEVLSPESISSVLDFSISVILNKIVQNYIFDLVYCNSRRNSIYLSCIRKKLN